MRPLLGLWISLMLAAPALAVVHDLPTGSANTTPPPDDPGFANVGNVGGLSAVYIGNGWVLTAAHVSMNSVVFDGTPYPPVPGSHVPLEPVGGATLPPDVALWRLEQPWPDLPFLLIQDTQPDLGTPVTMIGNGADRTGTGTCNLLPAYTWSGAHNIRWGTNHVEGLTLVESKNVAMVPIRETWSLISYFDCTCDGATGDTEAMAVDGDSGGGVFLKGPLGAWRRAGIMFGVQRCSGGFATRGDSFLEMGDRTYSADLSMYRSQILAIAAPPIPVLPAWGLPLLGGLLMAAGARRLRSARGQGPKTANGSPRAR